MKRTLLFSFALALSLLACKKDENGSDTPQPVPSGPKLIFRFAFNPDQERLNNIGQPAIVPEGRAAQSPVFHGISAHYLEMAPTMWTQLGSGEVLYHAPETTAGGANAIDFDQSVIVGEGQDFYSIPLKDVTPGEYTYMRVSLSYQNYDIQFRYAGSNYSGRLSSFVGFNNYITSYTIRDAEIAVNDDRLQGYWGFEASVPGVTIPPIDGQAPPGATTVPNPLSATSPIPAGSCVVTGPFTSPLVITGNETDDIIVTLSLSTNHSFEWVEVTEDGFYEPSIGENVVDMGLRGLIPIVE